MKKAILTFAALIVIAAGVYYLQGPLRVKSAQPCWHKLVNIESAKEQWATETKTPPGAAVTIDDILPYLQQMPTCHVAGAKYILGKIGEEPRCTVHGTVSQFKSDRY
jgi:hypothetical protein